MAKHIFGIDVRDFRKIGFGAEGAVYLSADNRVLKVFMHRSRCASEYKMLVRFSESNYFPKVYQWKAHYMLREYVEGTPLLQHLKEKGLSDALAENLINLSEFFDKHQSIRLDGISRHIFVLHDESLKVIDPRNKKYTFYKRLFEALRMTGCYDAFLQILKEKRPDLAGKWLGLKAPLTPHPFSDYPISGRSK